MTELTRTEKHELASILEDLAGTVAEDYGNGESCQRAQDYIDRLRTEAGPPEPGYAARVTDSTGGIWARIGEGWWLVNGSTKGITWDDFLTLIETGGHTFEIQDNAR